MADPIDDLVQHWKQNPSAATTLALCDALRESPRGPLVQQVGEFATQRHANDAVVLVSVARMYMEASRFSDAQSVLVAAGRIAPRDGNIYRWLGEALLRRGDADRAERVLERAIQLGATDAAARVWLERARTFRPMQATAGTRAVAGEVAHATAPAREELDSENENENTTDVTIPRPGLNARAAGPPPPLVRPPAAPRFARDTETAPVAFETPGLAISPRMPAPSSSGELISSIDLEDSVQVPLPTSPSLPKRTGLPFPPKRADPNGPTPRAGPDGLPVPYARDVMDALALAGVFEPDAAGATRATVWDRPGMGPKRKGSATLIAGMVMFLAATVATFLFYRQKREKDHLQAEALLVTVEAQLYAGRPDSLWDAERALAHAFQLESRSRRAALDWARERAMAGLVKSAADVAFEDAMARAKEVGVPEEKIAFAHVASFLFQGDTAGAAAVLPRWDGPAAGDAWYQLVAGAALERAGDVRARDRYAQAVKLEPTLVVAQVSLARATAFGDDTAEAMRLAKALRVQLPDRAEPVALVALAWGRDLRREDAAAPHEVDEVSKRGDELPSGLKFVPPAIAALRAFDRRAADDTRAEVRRGLAVAESPGAAVWLGTIALPLGDEALARKAALSALQLSAVYEPARALAARVALLGGRLDEALKATEELDPASGDVAVVRAASAYERVDADGVVRALEALSPDSRKLPFVEALGLAANALSGRVQLDAAKLLALAGDDAPWSDLVAMDIALDAGDLGPADKIADMWGKDSESQALRALRLARLARYEGRMDAADALSQTALNQGTATPRVLWERSFILVARSRAAEVGPLLARYPLVLGPVATWLSAYASASSGGVEAAKGKTASLDPPPASAPLEARVVAAAAFGAMKDNRRGWNYVKDVLATGSLHPDLVAAALQLGFRKVDRYHRRPIYE
jgi:predicted Zn-dependent protease